MRRLTLQTTSPRSPLTDASSCPSGEKTNRPAPALALSRTVSRCGVSSRSTTAIPVAVERDPAPVWTERHFGLLSDRQLEMINRLPKDSIPDDDLLIRSDRDDLPIVQQVGDGVVVAVQVAEQRVVSLPVSRLSRACLVGARSRAFHGRQQPQIQVVCHCVKGVRGQPSGVGHVTLRPCGVAWSTATVAAPTATPSARPALRWRQCANAPCSAAGGGPRRPGVPYRCHAGCGHLCHRVTKRGVTQGDLL